MILKSNILTENDCYKAGRSISPSGLMIHSVGTSQPDAKVFLSRWDRSGTGACAHALIDGLTDNAYQLLPWNMRGWHAGGSANDSYIGVEMCEPRGIKYTGSGSAFIVTDPEEARQTIAHTYRIAVELFAKLAQEFQIPMEKIIDHSTGCKMGIASNHADVMHLWQSKTLGTNYTLDGFRKDIQAEIEKSKTNILYRVQVGAFRNREYAVRLRDKLKSEGYDDVFIVSSQK